MAWPTLPENRPLAIAHRGASGEILENTIPAIERAIQLGADGVEIDVQFTSDGEIVVFHDPDLKRLAGRPEFISDLTLAEVREIPLIDPVAEDHPQFRMPTLAEVLAVCHARARVDIELKTDDPQLVDAVLATLAAADFSEYAYLTSFNPHYLAAIHAKAPELWVGHLIALEEQFDEVLKSPYVGACIPMWLATEERIAALRDREKVIVVWTVNNLDDIYRCIDLGVDALVTNFPDRVIQARQGAAGV